MASTWEQSENTDTLPRPELNPLLNPVLSENMGRWAEVYFTSPAEKREGAVIELLHELEKEKKNGTVDPPAQKPASTNPGRYARVVPEIFAQNQNPLAYRFCGACGSENPGTHQFCGMCGTKLQQDSSPHESVPADGRDTAPMRIRFAEERTVERVPTEESYQQEHYVEPAFHAPAAGNDDLSLFQSFRSPEPDEDWAYEPAASTPYRYYIAALLLIVIGALGYMAWRGAQTSQSSHQVSPPPPAPVTESAQPTASAQQASNAPQPTAPAQQTAAPKSEPEAPALTPAPANTVSPPQNRVAKREVAENTPAPSPAEQQDLSQQASSSGTEELAMAERYLNGSIGQGRNSSEAATWLWKSIAKHNGQATILLADLYLRGDGVSKNCEQGRVLLDSAARKGIPGAGDRLRNLQAFGCH